MGRRCSRPTRKRTYSVALSGLLWYLSHLGFSSDPSSKELVDADLWLPPSKQAQRDELPDAVHAHAAPPGTTSSAIL